MIKFEIKQIGTIEEFKPIVNIMYYEGNGKVRPIGKKFFLKGWVFTDGVNDFEIPPTRTIDENQLVFGYTVNELKIISESSLN